MTTTKRQFLPAILVLFVASISTVLGQGTILFPNGQYIFAYGGLNEQPCPTGTHIGLFWGTEQNGSAAIQGLGNGLLSTPTYLIGPTPGILSPGTLPTYPVSGSSEGQRIWFKIGGWIGGEPNNPLNAQVYGESEPISVLLGPTAGPPAVWTPPTRFRLHVLVVPEPSVWALLVVGAGFLLLRRRKI